MSVNNECSIFVQMKWVADADLQTHPITGHIIDDEQIYTRTLVLWAVDMDINVDEIWRHARVFDSEGNTVVNTGSCLKAGVAVFPPCIDPTIRMMCKGGEYRGTLAKRMNTSSFKSVLSMDVQVANAMPNVKISGRNTIQITGCCTFALLRRLLLFFASDEMRCGVTLGNNQTTGFVIDIVLSNVFFHVQKKIDRKGVQTVFNALKCPTAVACYEPLTKDPSVTIKFFENFSLRDEELYFRWFYRAQPSHWQSLTHLEVRRILPLRGPQSPGIVCTTFRVFTSGSVVQVGRWPGSMIRDKQIVQGVLRAHKAPIEQKGGGKQAKIPLNWFKRTIETKDISDETQSCKQ